MKKPVFTQEQTSGILNGDYTQFITDTDCGISKAMFTEAVDAMELPANVSNGNVAVDYILNKLARTEEAISKNILYSGIKGTLNGVFAPFNGYNYTNLTDNRVPNLDAINKNLEKFGSSLFSGVSSTSTTITLGSSEAVTTFHKTLMEVCKNIADKYENIYGDIIANTGIESEDNESLGIVAYTFFRGGKELERKLVDDKAKRDTVAKEVASITAVYTNEFRTAVDRFKTIITKLNREIIAPTQQEKDQTKALCEKVANAFCKYVHCYLSRANVVYAAKADAIAELLGGKDVYAVADQNEDKHASFDPDSIFESFDMGDEDAIDYLDFTDNSIYALEASAAEAEFMYKAQNLFFQESADKFYAEYLEDKEITNEADIAAMAKDAVNKAKQAYNNKGDLAVRFRKLWAQFTAFLQSIRDKFKTSMATRIKNMQEFLANNEEAIKTNGANSNEIATLGDHQEGIKRILSTKLKPIDQYLRDAESGKVATVEEIQEQVSGAGFKGWKNDGSIKFVDHCKQQFLGTENGKKDFAVKSVYMDALTFCKDFEGYQKLSDEMDKDIAAVEKVVGAKLDQLTKTDQAQAQQQPSNTNNNNAGAQQPAPAGQSSATPAAKPATPTPAQSTTPHHNSVSYEDIKSYIKAYLEADGDDKGAGVAIKTQDGKSVSTGEGNATSDPEKKQANDISTLATNYQNVLRAVHTAKLTAFESIYADFDDILRGLVNGSAQQQQQPQQPAQGQQTQNNNNQQ